MAAGGITESTLTPQTARVLHAFEQAGGWITLKELAAAAGVGETSARNYIRQLLSLGALDELRVSAPRRYRLANKPPAAAREWIKRVRAAAEVLNSWQA